MTINRLACKLQNTLLFVFVFVVVVVVVFLSDYS